MMSAILLTIIIVKLHVCRSLARRDDEIKIFAPLLQLATSYTVFVSAAFCDFHIVLISSVCTSWSPIWIKISLRRHCDLTLCQLLMYCIDGCVYCKVLQRILHDWCVYRLVMQYIVQMSASPFLASISSLGMSLVAAHKLQPLPPGRQHQPDQQFSTFRYSHTALLQH